MNSLSQDSMLSAKELSEANAWFDQIQAAFEKANPEWISLLQLQCEGKTPLKNLLNTPTGGAPQIPLETLEIASKKQTA
jgi:hypothetical protein